ncbi:hypothetical protein [Streptomyces fulvorobeus]|uniref:Uncharacterized protein n=1 Tax=Streptomyces fulvorobeus TaxID=284028 RepID=A0A7Y9HHR2_9ACTN|nr:hypothetical protein [Streptomyces fulvorobeus]NYE44476.1 hypothetical protein [Streptomyces fulvorobeus]
MSREGLDAGGRVGKAGQPAVSAPRWRQDHPVKVIAPMALTAT